MSLCDWSAPVELYGGDTLEILRDLALEQARASGPYSEALVPLIEGRKWAALIAYEPDYSINAAAHHVVAMRQALGFFTKLENLDIGVDKEAVAWSKFVKAEALCKETNDIFRSREVGHFSFHPRVEKALRRAQRKIRSILGPCPKTLADVPGRFGPGATTDIKRNVASPANKLAAGLSCSLDVLASGRLPDALREVPEWTACLMNSDWFIDEEGWLVESIPVRITTGKLAFVAKSAKEERSIVVEPVLNGFWQAGIGDLIAKLLRKVGVDIRDATPNQRAALKGSLDGLCATVDLSSASDTIAYWLVKYLLPADWFALLSAFRTGTVTYKKSREIVLEKFSSMGNGFTFPLETLIFWCLARVVVPEGEVLAYGDDLVVPAAYYGDLVEVLNAVGFVVNPTKSFASGPFRESCGKDYYHGINVRPFYQKKPVSGQTLFTLHNYWIRQGLYDLAASVLRLIPRELRIYGPDGYGDGHLVSDKWPDRTSVSQRLKGWAGHTFETYTPLTRKHVSVYPGDWVSPLYSVYARAQVALADPIGFYEFPVENASSVDTWTKSRPLWDLPGVEGYKRTLIYTLG